MRMYVNWHRLMNAPPILPSAPSIARPSPSPTPFPIPILIKAQALPGSRRRPWWSDDVGLRFYFDTVEQWIWHQVQHRLDYERIRSVLFSPIINRSFLPSFVSCPADLASPTGDTMPRYCESEDGANKFVRIFCSQHQPHHRPLPSLSTLLSPP